MTTSAPRIDGSFIEKDAGKTHFFAIGAPAWMTDEFAAEHGITHTMETLDGNRGIRLLKTVAYVAVDEDEFGAPVFEKWSIRDRRDWV